ncbi:MAG: CPBP family intramembrane metalloprotease [Thermoanaerobaculia bacterium]|nr:CPBP family intramembrane metalloprotease [Thermoanaerobaculia bacterium]
MPNGSQSTPPVARPFGLRIALYLLVVYFCYIFGTNLLLYLIEGPEKLESLRESAQPEGELPVLPLLLGLKTQLILAPVILAITGLFAASDRRTLKELAVAWPAKRIIGPVAQVIAVVAAAVAIVGAWRLVAESWVAFTTLPTFPADQVEAMGRWLPPDAIGLVLFGATFVALAFVDEIIFRGYIFAVLRDRLPWIHAAGLSALIFALFHPGRPSVFAPSLLNIFLLGLFLAALREASGSLLLGSLFHGFWNFVLGCILSLPVSGLEMPRLESLQVEGPLWATGGDYGPEGSWLLTGFLLLAVLGATAWVESGQDDEGVAEPGEATA